MFRPRVGKVWRRRVGLVLSHCDEAYFLKYQGPRGF